MIRSRSSDETTILFIRFRLFRSFVLSKRFTRVNSPDSPTLLAVNIIGGGAGGDTLAAAVDFYLLFPPAL